MAVALAQTLPRLPRRPSTAIHECSAKPSCWSLIILRHPNWVKWPNTTSLRTPCVSWVDNRDSGAELKRFVGGRHFPSLHWVGLGLVNTTNTVHMNTVQVTRTVILSCTREGPSHTQVGYLVVSMDYFEIVSQTPSWSRKTSPTLAAACTAACGSLVNSAHGALHNGYNWLQGL